jgi:hypothetical protein
MAGLVSQGPLIREQVFRNPYLNRGVSFGELVDFPSFPQTRTPGILPEQGTLAGSYMDVLAKYGLEDDTEAKRDLLNISLFGDLMKNQKQSPEEIKEILGAVSDFRRAEGAELAKAAVGQNLAAQGIASLGKMGEAVNRFREIPLLALAGQTQQLPTTFGNYGSQRPAFGSSIRTRLGRA